MQKQARDHGHREARTLGGLTPHVALSYVVMAWIEFSDADGRLRKVEVPRTATGVVLGRSASCHVILKSPSVGRNHGKVLFQGGVFIYKDLGSINGSFINGQRVEDDVPLKDGDSLRLGEVVVRFFTDPRPPSPPAQSVKPQPLPQQEPAAPLKRTASPPAPASGAEALSLVEVSRLRKENDALRAEVAALQRQLNERSALDAEDLQRRLIEARSALAEREDEVRHLRGVMADTERRLKDAEGRAATANSSLESIHSKYLDMREQVAHVQGLLQQARDSASKREAEAAELHEKVASLQAQIEAVRTRSGQTTEEVQNLKVKVTEKDREIERLKRELDIREYDLKALKEENERLQDYCASDSGRQGDLERKVRNLEAVIEDNRNLIAEMRRLVEDKDRELRAVRLGVGLADLEHEKARLLDDFHKKSREVDDQRSQIAALTAALEAARAVAEEHLTRIRQLEEAARIRKSEREDISDHPEYRARVREIERLNEQVATLVRDLDALQRERETFSPEERARILAELQASQERVRALQWRLEETQARLDTVQSAPVAPETPAPCEPELEARLAEHLDAVMDDVRVFQAECRDLIGFLEGLDRSGIVVPEEVASALHGVTLSEALESLRELMKIMARDALALQDLVADRLRTRNDSLVESEKP